MNGGSLLWLNLIHSTGVIFVVRYSATAVCKCMCDVGRFVKSPCLWLCPITKAPYTHLLADLSADEIISARP
jgi:hypothetical protein